MARKELHALLEDPELQKMPPPAKLVRKAWPPTASVLLTTAVMVYDCVEPAAMVSCVVGDTVVALPILMAKVLPIRVLPR